MRKMRNIVFALSLLTCGAAHGGDRLPAVGTWACATAGQRNFACKSPDDLRRFDRLALSFDYEAEEKWRDEKEASGQCVRLGDGKIVMVEDRRESSFCVRPRGETECFWSYEGEILSKAGYDALQEEVQARFNADQPKAHSDVRGVCR
jgi:hypothetical protein